MGAGTGVSLSISSAKHPEELPNVIIPINACEKYTSYGLESANSKKFNVQFKDAAFSITMPVQSDSGSNHAGYIALIQRSGDDKEVAIPKYEAYSSGAVPSVNSASLGIQLNSYDASANDLDLLVGSSSPTVCQLSPSKIAALINKFTALLNYSVRNSEERTYKLEGVPYNMYNPLDGLTSFSMIIGSSGLTTSLNFSNTFAFKLTPDLLLKKLKYLRLQQFGIPKGKLIDDSGGNVPSI
jgi:hypothetical protein